MTRAISHPATLPPSPVVALPDVATRTLFPLAPEAATDHGGVHNLDSGAAASTNTNMLHQDVPSSAMVDLRRRLLSALPAIHHRPALGFDYGVEVACWKVSCWEARRRCLPARTSQHAGCGRLGPRRNDPYNLIQWRGTVAMVFCYAVRPRTRRVKLIGIGILRPPLLWPAGLPAP
jgi:hypothetical protein